MKEELLPPLVLFKFSPREISTSSKLLPSLLLLASRASLSLVSLAADTEGKKVRRQRSREDSRQRCFVPLYQRVYTLVLSSFQTFLVSITFLLLLLLLLFSSLLFLSRSWRREKQVSVYFHQISLLAFASSSTDYRLNRAWIVHRVVNVPARR